MKKRLIITITFITCSMLVFTQNVNIPDANFKAYLVANTFINTNGDTEIQLTEASAFSGHINCPNMGITSLVGIEEFTGITQLTAWSNQITFVDLSDNIALTFVRLENNLLTNIILNRNNSLIYYLWLQGNQLTNFNPAEHPLLEFFSIRFNQISSLDITQNPLLKYLGCGSNMLTSLDVTQNPVLETLFFDNNNITNINLAQNSVLKYISCTNNQLQTLDFTQNVLMEEITCWNNQIASINVAQCPVLDKLNISQNQLTSLDVSQNIALTELFCDNNPITSLDVTQNTSLLKLGVYTMPLTYLNMQNGNNSNMTYYSSSFTPNLICIYVDDPVYSNANWTNIHVNNNFVINQASCAILSNVSHLQDDLFTVYPNPTKGLFTLEVPNHWLATSTVIEIRNLLGVVVYSSTIDSSLQKIDLSNEASGIYLLKISNSEQTVTQKIIKE